MSKHSQVKMSKGTLTQVSWIPADYATKGRLLKLRERGGEWDNGWIVEDVYATLNTDTVMKRSQDYKNTREASDI